MSRHKTDTELSLAQAKTTLRTLVHLKHALAYMEEINELEPELEERYAAAVNAGKSFTLDVKALVDRIDRG